MKNIILLSPFTGNGGIASWSRKYIKTFRLDGVNIIPIDRRVTGRAFEETSAYRRFVAGMAELRQIKHEMKDTIANNEIALLHTTTSGSFGTYRDYVVAKMCRRHNIPVILHLHYGCVAEDLKNLWFGKFLFNTMCLYNQVWVLDKRSEATLKRYPELRGKVFLTPNSINVSKDVEVAPKTYHHVAFVGNLVPTKGLYELVRATLQVKHPVTLSIVGSGSEEVFGKIEELAGQELGKKIRILGQLPNDKAVEFMKTVDIVALPTYYPWEAFPISILEAMSLGKLVISTRRAAIGDMLTGLDGSPCGCFVEEHSVEDITKAVEWAIENSHEADERCKRAYQKVSACYSTEVVYKLYADLYKRLLK